MSNSLETFHAAPAEGGTHVNTPGESVPAATIRQEPLPKLPAAVMHQAVQSACDHQARIFGAVQKLNFHLGANHRKNKLAILTLALRDQLPLRQRKGSKQNPPPRKYRARPSLDLLNTFDFIYGVYTPNKDGEFKYANYFDELGRFSLNTKKVSQQLNIPLRTFQRALAKLTAMRLIASTQDPKYDQRCEYAGSETWVTPRADVYLELYREVLAHKSRAKFPEPATENPTADLPETAGESAPNQPPEPSEIETAPNDKIDICSILIIKPPVTVPQSPSMEESGALGNHCGAAAPAALPPVVVFTHPADAPTATTHGNEVLADAPGVDPGITPVAAPASDVPPGQNAALSCKQAEDALAILPAPVATIDDPTAILAAGCQCFDKFAKRIAQSFPDCEFTTAHLYQLRSWLMRSSPLERMTFDELDDILWDHDQGGKFQNASGRHCSLTLDWLLKSWPKFLHELKQTKLGCAGAGAIDQKLELMTTQAEADFEKIINGELAQIRDFEARNVSRPLAFTIQPRNRFVYCLVAYHRLGMTAQIDEIVNDPELLGFLREGMDLDPFTTLQARQKYPNLFARCAIEAWFWNRLKNAVKKTYQNMLRLKSEAQRWKVKTQRKYHIYK